MGRETGTANASPKDDVAAKDQVIGITHARAGTYRLLASLYYRELTQEQIEHIHGLDPFAFDDFDPLFAEGVHDVERALRHVDSGTREELAVDYAHSMLGAGAYDERRATPFESVFTSDAGLLMQDARDDVRKLFLAEGLKPDPSQHVPEDHLSFIFEFMAVLCDRLVAALLAGDVTEARRCCEVQAEVHAHHLANWVDDYCDVLDRVALTRFYRGVSKMTRSFVRLDAVGIEDTAAALDALA